MSIRFFIVTFVFGMASCIGFCILNNIPRRSIIAASCVGGFAWLGYQISLESGSSKAIAAFWGACAVAIVSEIFSRLLKEAATVFIIPGILPLVPGAGMYYTMTELIHGSYEAAGKIANETFFIAGSIALALLVTGSFVRIFTTITKKIPWN